MPPLPDSLWAYAYRGPAHQQPIQQGDRLELPGIRAALEEGWPIIVGNVTNGRGCWMSHVLSQQQVEMLRAGGLTRFLQRKWGVQQ